ncbi:MAG: hypothetical protein RR581_08810, partial [Eubacterium sp.]
QRMRTKPTDKVKLLIKGHLYQMTKQEAVKTINQIKTERKGTNSILALEKNKIFEMRDDTFKTSQELTKKIKEYNKMGYIVHKIRKIE